MTWLQHQLQCCDSLLFPHSVSEYFLSSSSSLETGVFHRNVFHRNIFLLHRSIFLLQITILMSRHRTNLLAWLAYPPRSCTTHYEAVHPSVSPSNLQQHHVWQRYHHRAVASGFTGAFLSKRWLRTEPCAALWASPSPVLPPWCHTRPLCSFTQLLVPQEPNWTRWLDSFTKVGEICRIN